MTITDSLDNLISQLTLLRKKLEGEPSVDSTFETVFEHSAEQLKEQIEPLHGTSDTPSWINPDVNYDVNAPRKPSKAEFMYAVLKKPFGDLEVRNSEEWKNLRAEASDIMYGVIGSNEDSRDWGKIMSAPDILSAARDETQKMYKPTISIFDTVNDEGVQVDQNIMITSSTGTPIRTLSKDIETADNWLQTFGVTKQSMPENFSDNLDTRYYTGGFVNYISNYKYSNDKVLNYLSKIENENT